MPTPEVYLRQIARLTADGLEPEQIRAVTDLDVTFIRRLQGEDTFLPALREFSEDAAKLWAESKSLEHARKRVKLAARADAPEHYQMLRDLVRDQKNDLKTLERANLLRDMIKFSGAVDEAMDEEVVSLTPSHLAIIQETLREVG